MKLIDVVETFKTDDDCLAYLETMRWPDGIRCPLCGGSEISKITRKKLSKNKRTRIYQCLEPTCQQQFSATSGTIFNDSHLPLVKWLMAVALVVDAKKGISAKQLQEHLGIGSYRTAWYMAHRIRKSMEISVREPLTGIVEMDETYVGGRSHGPAGRGRSLKNKEVVIGMKQRNGEVRFFHAINASSATIAKFIKENISPSVEAVMTDEWNAYPKAMIEASIHGSKHKTIRHKSGIYVNGDITTNGIESAFSLLKRGILGQFHWISVEHLHRYLAEFEYRFNERNNPQRFQKTLNRMTTTAPMTYADLVR